MGSWKQDVLAIAICALSCGIVIQIISDTRAKALVQLICGTLLIISVLNPLTKINPEELFSLSFQDWKASDTCITAGKQAAAEARSACIKASCETYILDKAKNLGAEIVASVSLSEEMLPISVELMGHGHPNVQRKLQQILTNDLGIPKEHQTWIWNQESSSSSIP